MREATDTAARIEAEIRAAGTAARAVSERAYLKTQLECLGASMPEVRRIVKQVVAEDPTRNHDDVLELVDTLWSAPIHDRRLAAVELLGFYAALLGPGDLPFLERLLRESLTWALVDPLAVHVVGGVVERDAAGLKTLDIWVTDPDFWIRRAAMLALLRPLRRGEGEVERFFRYADELLSEREFFIRKAIGWILRDMGRKRPELVRDWVAPRTGRMSGVTLREALKPLAPGDAAMLLDAYRAKRPAVLTP